jgi:hypothetical protein
MVRATPDVLSIVRRIWQAGKPALQTLHVAGLLLHIRTREVVRLQRVFEHASERGLAVARQLPVTTTVATLQGEHPLNSNGIMSLLIHCAMRIVASSRLC